MHHIRTGDSPPFRHTLRTVPFSRRQYLEQEVQRLLTVGAIAGADPGACPYASRTVVAMKKDGSLRMCVDYRDLNAATETDSFPLPRIDEVWPMLARAQYFASLDLLMGYHHVEVAPEDRAKTAFITHQGLYVYNVMPCMLINAPATFQRLMQRILGPYIGVSVLVYLDDVLFFAADRESLLSSFDTVLKLFVGANLKYQPTKCKLASTTIYYLGHVVSSEGIRL